MQFHKIDIDSWTRKETYERFIESTPCSYSITINLDITRFLLNIKSADHSFFSSFLFAITRTVNRHIAFRMDYDSEGNLGYYSHSNPFYTIFHPETETFTNVWSEFDENFDIFTQNFKSDMAKYQNDPKTSKPLAKNNYFNLSAIPWTTFTGFNLNLQNGYNYLLPIFTVGRYFTENDKTLIPLALQVHHAVCDGYHLSQFIDDLQDFLSSFEV